jgi:MerR family transcriptional regulator/heat shock protein HspR
MHPAFVERIVRFGLLMPIEQEGDQLFFDVSAAPRLRTIARLRQDLGINLSGISVILDLVDKLYTAQRENDRLRTRR